MSVQFKARSVARLARKRYQQRHLEVFTALPTNQIVERQIVKPGEPPVRARIGLDPVAQLDRAHGYEP